MEPAEQQAAERMPDNLDGRIVDALLQRGRLKDADLGRVRRLQEESGGSLTSLLARLGMVSERDIAEASAEVLDLPLIAARDCPDAPPALQLSTRFLKQHHACPIGEDAEFVDLLVADAQDPYPAEAVALATGRTVRLRIGMRSEIDDRSER